MEQRLTSGVVSEVEVYRCKVPRAAIQLTGILPNTAPDVTAAVRGT